MKKAVIYLRVSTEEQAEKGFSLQAQREMCLQKAEELECGEIAEFSDEGVSGSILERPMLLNALDELERKHIDFFICYEPSRLSRNVSHQLILIDNIKKHNTKLIFIQSSYEDTAEGRFQLTIMAAVDEYERARLKIRTELGKRAKANQRILTHNPNLYGYFFDKEKDILTLNPEQAAVVRLMYHLLIDKEKSPTQITEELNRMDIPSMRNKRWSRISVNRVLKNFSYTGTLYIRRYDTKDYKANKYKKKDEKIKLTERPKEQWIPIKIPSIIDVETWQCAKLLLDKGKRIAGTNRLSEYLLSGLLICSVCGGTMFGKKSRNGSGKENKYYCCSNKYNYKLSKEKRCTSGLIKADELENEIWEMVKSWITAEAIINIDKKDMNKGTIYANEEYEQFNKAAEAEREKLLTLFQKSLISEEQLEQKLKIIEIKVQHLQNELIYGDRHPIEKNTFNPLEGATLKKKLESMTAFQKNKLLHIIIKEIKISDEKVYIIAYMPIPVA